MKNELEELVWIAVSSCPACGKEGSSPLGKLAIEEYRFGDESIPLPQEGIEISQCLDCGLVFKNTLPSPKFLAEVFRRQKGKVWAGGYDFSEEAELIRGLVGASSFDLLDIGASNGGLLKAFSESEGRRSALDVISHPGLEAWIRGEFISGLAESKDLSWSGEPYDVVGMFDIAEHLYDPEQAFSNLRFLVKRGGFVVAETGDVQSYWPQKFGVHRWWYACLFEHHVFWSRSCMEQVANRHGFQLINFQRKRHKDRSKMSPKRDFLAMIKSLNYRLYSERYVRLARVLGKSSIQPWSPFTRDHLRVVLKRED